MSIIKWFNKPKWQSNNEQVRITAIQSSQDPDLINHLLNIVNTDSSEKVQIAALHKINNYNDINGIVLNHPNKKIQTIAKKKLLTWMTSKPDSAQQLVFSQIKDHELIQAIAQDAADKSIKLQAIKQINQQGFLGDLLLKTSNPEIQAALLQQITQESTIQRLIEKINKKNKKLRSQLEQKLTSNDNFVNEQQALMLCQNLEAVVHGKNQQSIDLTKIDQQFQLLQNDLPEKLKLRFTGAYEAARMILDPQHRTEFLQKQKNQRFLTLLADIEQAVKNTRPSSLVQIQSHLDRLNELDGTLLAQSDNAKVESLQATLLNQREQVQQEQKIPDAAIELVDEITQVLNRTTAAPQELNQFKSQWQKAIRSVKNSDALNQLTEQFDQLCLKLAEKIERSAELRNQAAKQAVSLIEKASSLIDEGQLAQAKITTNEIAKNKQLAGYSHPVIKQNKYQLDQIWTRLKELRDWQKWSNDKARQEIINSLVNIHGQGIHPDAVLKKLKDSNEQWYALEDMEKLAGDKYPSRNQAMWLEFRQVSKAIFEPTQPFFEQRSEQQNSRLDEINSLIAEIDACDLSTASERDLARISRNALNELKSLDQLPPKQRGLMARKLRKSISRVDNKLNEFYQAAEDKKLNLIMQAQALHELEDINEAINKAKDLQQQWKTAGIVKQFTERKLWKKFRKANDALFNKRDHVQKAVDEVFQQQKSAVADFLKTQQKQLKSLKSTGALHEFKTNCQKSWHELDNDKQFMQTDFNHLLLQIEEQQTVLNNQALIDECNINQQIDLLYSQYEQGEIELEALHQSLAKIGNTDITDNFKSRIDHEFDTETLTNQLIAAEFLTGLETPEAQMEQRMAYQVKILSERMSGEKSPTDYVQARLLLNEWFMQPKHDQAFTNSHKKRINQVIDALKKLAYSQ